MRLLACVLAAASLTATALAGTRAKPLPLSGRLLRAGELQGFTPPARAELFSAASAWASGFADPTKETTRLQKLGFVAAGYEELTSTLRERDAVSVVIQFRTESAARANMSYSIATDRTGGIAVTSFAVPGIPGARGLDAHRSGGAGYDVVFVDGPFFYDVGAYTPSPKQPPTAAQVVAAAKKLYARVHGRSAA